MDLTNLGLSLMESGDVDGAALSYQAEKPDSTLAEITRNLITLLNSCDVKPVTLHPLVELDNSIKQTQALIPTPFQQH